MSVRCDNNLVRTVALAGNPNVGKSTLFNLLTGMHQHTGNWTGKTVGTATGECKRKDKVIRLIDLPGTYSLNSHSEEEEIAKVIGTSQSYYAQYESGKRAIPLERMIALAKYYNVSLDYLAGLIDTPRRLK